jgi:hypothetical protein
MNRNNNGNKDKGSRAFRRLFALAFFVVIAAVAFYPFSNQQKDSAVIKVVQTGLDDVKNVVVTHEGQMAAAMLEEMKVI